MTDTDTAATDPSTTLAHRGCTRSDLCPGGQRRGARSARPRQPPSKVHKPSAGPAPNSVTGTSRPLPKISNLRPARRTRLGREEGLGVPRRGRHRHRPNHRPGPTDNHQHDRRPVWRFCHVGQPHKPIPPPQFPRTGRGPIRASLLGHHSHRSVGRGERPQDLPPDRTAPSRVLNDRRRLPHREGPREAAPVARHFLGDRLKQSETRLCRTAEPANPITRSKN